MTFVIVSRFVLKVPGHPGLHPELEGQHRCIEGQAGEARVELQVVQAVGPEDAEGEVIVVCVRQAARPATVPRRRSSIKIVCETNPGLSSSAAAIPQARSTPKTIYGNKVA